MTAKNRVAEVIRRHRQEDSRIDADLEEFEDYCSCGWHGYGHWSEHVADLLMRLPDVFIATKEKP